MPEEPLPPRSTKTRKLAAIMFTDMVGFSRQMGSNEARLLRLLEVHNQLIRRAVAQHHGTVIKTIGDAFLVDFPSVVHAVQCAQEIQGQFRVHNVEKSSADQIHVRIGIHLGDIVQREGDVFGDGVNIASRLQTLAEPDTICLSHVVYQEVVKKLDLGTVVSLGRPKLKNIVQRFQVYALLPETPQGLRQTLQVQWLKFSRRVGTTHLMGLVAVLGLVAGVFIAFYSPSLFPLSTQDSALGTAAAPTALPLPDKPSIVVLPFTNLSSDPEQEYFSDGITEDLTSDLSKISSLFVIARNSAFTYKGKATKVQDISRELGVRYVLEGSVRKADNQLRITAQLVDATTGGQMWSERYDRPLKEIFALQDEIVQKIVTTLKLQLTLLEQGVLVRKDTDSLEAYDYWLRGIESFLHRSSPETLAQTRQMFEKAIDLDPQYAQAYAILGLTYVLEWGRQWTADPQVAERGIELIRKAIVLDDTDSLAHSTLGYAYLWGKKQHDQALTEVERALALDPNNAAAYATLAEILTFTGQPEKAITEIKTAMRLNPHYPSGYLFTLGRAYLLTKQYEEAIVTFKKVAARSPDNFGARVNLATIYSELGRETEARAEVAEVLRISPNFSLEGFKQRLPYKDLTTLDLQVVALRKAGLK
jgi:adenylate cyclase